MFFSHCLKGNFAMLTRRASEATPDDKQASRPLRQDMITHGSAHGIKPNIRAENWTYPEAHIPGDLFRNGRRQHSQVGDPVDEAVLPGSEGDPAARFNAIG